MKKLLLASVCALALIPAAAQATTEAEAEKAEQQCRNEITLDGGFLEAKAKMTVCLNKYTSTHWLSRNKTDKLDDSTQLGIFTTAVELIDNVINQPEPSVLYVRCDGSKHETEMFVKTPRQIGGGIDHLAQVKWKIDQGKITTEQWTVSKGGDAVFARLPVPALKDMIGKNELIISVPSYNKQPETVTFNLTGLGDALKPIREQCKW